jgi:hypothetical protein
VISILTLKKDLKISKNFFMNTPDIVWKMVFTAAKRKKNKVIVKVYVGNRHGIALDTDVESGVREHTFHLPHQTAAATEDTF